MKLYGGDLGIEPLNLRRNKRKVVWFSRLLKKGKDSFCKEVFEKELNINKLKEDFECKKYLLYMESLTSVLSFCLDLDLEPMV